MTPLDPDGARIVARLHDNIASLIDGNHVERSEVINAGGRSCDCRLLYEVDWSFVPRTSQQRVQGDGAVSTHFGYYRNKFDAETAHRCDLGRTHKPIREGFLGKVLEAGGAAVAWRDTQVWDFGQHSVHEDCGTCGSSGRVSCSSCSGNGRTNCHQCYGSGSTTQTRYVQGRNETYRQSCYGCGGSGRVTCSGCGGSGRVQCHSCAGYGFFTDIMNVTVRAEPQVRITTRSQLSREALQQYLLELPVVRAVDYLDFTQCDQEDLDESTWRVGYEVHTTVVELDLTLRAKTYMAAAVGDKALAFIRPPIFDDVLIEEITDLQQIWSGRKKSFSNDRARKFFATYCGQPVLDAALKSLAKLKSKDRQSPGDEVMSACQGYISSQAAKPLGECMIALLDKVSPPNSRWSWIGVMALPFLLLFLAAQNWTERNIGGGYASVARVWVELSLIAVFLTLLVAPAAAFVSTIVSAIRRRAVPPEYRQHGRNWQPLKSFLFSAVAVTTLGGGAGLLTHYDKLPRWNNRPMDTIESALNLNRFPQYVQAAAQLEKVGFFVSPEQSVAITSATKPIVFDIQNNLNRLGYNVPVTGLRDDVTRKAVAAYQKKRKIKVKNEQALLTALCKDLRGTCAKVSQIQ